MLWSDQSFFTQGCVIAETVPSQLLSKRPRRLFLKQEKSSSLLYLLHNKLQIWGGPDSKFAVISACHPTCKTQSLATKTRVIRWVLLCCWCWPWRKGRDVDLRKQPGSMQATENLQQVPNSSHFSPLPYREGNITCSFVQNLRTSEHFESSCKPLESLITDLRTRLQCSLKMHSASSLVFCDRNNNFGLPKLSDRESDACFVREKTQNATNTQILIFPNLSKPKILTWAQSQPLHWI